MHDEDTDANLPVVNVSWHDAAAYAVWLGGSLPTESQWEFAVRGKEGRTYPWGEEPASCDRANYVDCGQKPMAVKEGRAQGRTKPEGIYDLAGNVFEWCRDWFGEYSTVPQTDPLGPPTGTRRVLRGGSIFGDADDLRGTFRSHEDPTHRPGVVGFRVV